jgi:hypothetical protein
MNIPARYCTGYLGDIGVAARPTRQEPAIGRVMKSEEGTSGCMDALEIAGTTVHAVPWWVRFAGGSAYRPSSFGIGADPGHHEHRRPSTIVSTEASG